MAKKIIDTDVIIEFLRGDSSLYNDIVGQLISVITVSEIYYGEIYLHGLQEGKIRLNELINHLDLEVIDIDFDVALKFTELKRELEKNGLKIEDMDLLIASTAIVSNVEFLTNNKKHFTRIKQLKLV